MNLYAQRESGSSMIEVLVTLLVFTIGMLGLAALQLNSLQGTSDSAQRSQTTWLLQDIAERIRANPEGTAAAYATAANCAVLPAEACADYYDPATSAKVNATNCTAVQMAAFDRWETQCSYAAIAAFNSIDARFTSRDFINAPASGTTLSIVNSSNVLTIKGQWLGKADNVKSPTGEHISETTALQVQR